MKVAAWVVGVSGSPSSSSGSTIVPRTLAGRSSISPETINTSGVGKGSWIGSGRGRTVLRFKLRTSIVLPAVVTWRFSSRIVGS
jgi:hypothetical protein